MRISLNAKCYAERVEPNSFALVEDRHSLYQVGAYSILHDALTMLELYQQYFEVMKECAVAPRTEEMVNKRDRLTAEIQSRIDAHI